MSALTTSTEFDLAFGLLLFVVIATLFVLILTVFLRGSLIRANHQRNLFLQLWRPLITGAAYGVQSALPPLARRYVKEFMLEWNSLYEKLNGDSREYLRNFANQLNLAGTAAKLLIHRDQRQRLIAITTLGNLGEKRVYHILDHIARSDEYVLALASIRSLMKIDQHHALTNFIPVLLTRDWPIALVSRLFKETDPSVICRELSHHAKTVEGIPRVRLIQLMNVCKCASATYYISNLLNTTNDKSLINLCLKSLQDPTAIDTVIRYLAHDDWMIRVAAATAFGRIGSIEHIDEIIPLLSDREWWVRYRAAQALVLIPRLNDDALVNLQQSLDDRYAADILKQAIAEKRLLLI